MTYTGLCTCGRWKLSVEFDKPLGNLTPRNCDCEYCRKHPSQIVSDPDMSATFTGKGDKAVVRKNGDQLANFYYCSHCDLLLAVCFSIHGYSHGALNCALLGGLEQFGEPMKITPYLLSTDEKLQRWKTIWGVVGGLETQKTNPGRN